jgi:hypothetical protein
MIYLALEGGPPRFSQGYTCPDLLNKTNIRSAKLYIPGYHSLWRSFPTTSARIANFLPYVNHGRIYYLSKDLNEFRTSQRLFVMLQPFLNIRLPTYPTIARWKPKKFGLFRIRSPLLTESLFTFFSSGY